MVPIEESYNYKLIQFADPFSTATTIIENIFYLCRMCYKGVDKSEIIIIFARISKDNHCSQVSPLVSQKYDESLSRSYFQEVPQKVVVCEPLDFINNIKSTRIELEM